VSATPSPLSQRAGTLTASATLTVATAWPTPKAFKAYRLVICALVLLLLGQGEATLAAARRAFKVIGKDTVPSIIAAEEIGYALADLDANVANSLLGNAQHRQTATAAIEKQRLKVTDSLVDAAQNITYGDAEKVPIRAMTRDLGLYLERAAEARLRYEQGDLPGARTSYWQATDLLHRNLLVEANDLDAANKLELDAAYTSGKRETRGAELVACLVGLLLVGALLALQIFLFRKTRRVFSAPILLATFLAVILPVYLAVRFTAASESLRVAKEDAFDSIHSLVRARTIAYDLNGDESRFLLDTNDARGFGAAFKSKVATLSTTATDKPPSRAELVERKRNMAAGRQVKDTGLFWNELDNVTFDGEYAAANRMVLAFRDYLTIDLRVRKLAASGKMADAVELAIGDKPDESNAAFDRFDVALAATVDINRAAFDHEMDSTNGNLGTAETVSVALCLLIAGLTWLGLRPRLREYTA
jgi:hypothetical protein